MKLSVNDRLQFQYLLPVQGNFKTLEMVEKILAKLRIEKTDEEDKEFVFSRDEIELLKQSIAILDQANKLNLQSLPTIRKIMEEIQ